MATELDQFILDKDMPYWMATLSNGQTVYEDDDRPELEEKNAWKRLKCYCEINKIYIEKLDLVFRSNRISIDTSDWDGVFFIKSLLGFIKIHKGGKPIPQKRFPTRQFYKVGRLSGGGITTTKYEVPAMMTREVEEREVGQLEKDMTIRKHEVHI